MAGHEAGAGSWQQQMRCGEVPGALPLSGGAEGSLPGAGVQWLLAAPEAQRYQACPAAAPPLWLLVAGQLRSLVVFALNAASRGWLPAGLVQLASQGLSCGPGGSHFSVARAAASALPRVAMLSGLRHGRAAAGTSGHQAPNTPGGMGCADFNARLAPSPWL